MTLIPAAQCFLRLVGHYLMSTGSTVNTSKSSNEVVEIFRNPGMKPSNSQTCQDWTTLFDTKMIRSTSLQNLSVSHFNFFPLSPTPEPDGDATSSSEKYLRTKSQESDKLIHSLKQNVSRLNKMMERKDNELAEVNRKMQNYHKYYCWSLVQVANLLKDQNTLRDENINLQLLVEEYCTDNEYYEGKLKEYRDKLNNIEKEMTELNSRSSEINQLKSANESWKVKCEIQENEVKKCKKMMDLYKNRLEQFQQLVDTKNKEISSLKNTISHLETRLIEVQKEKANVLRDIHTMRNDNEEMTTKNKELTDKILMLERSLNESKAEILNLSQNVKSLQEENEQLSLSHSDLQKEIEDRTLDLEKINEKLEVEINKRCREISQITSTNESLKVECEMHENEVKKCKKMMDLYKNRLEQFQQMVDTKNTENKDLMNKIIDLESSLHEFKAESSNLAQNVKSLQEENKQLKLSHSDLQDKMNASKVNFEQQLKDKGAQIVNSQKFSTKKEQELQEQLELVNEDLLLSKKHLEAIQTELKMAKTELKCKNELGRVMENEHHKLNLSYGALYKEFSSTMDELNRSKKELKQLKESLATSEGNKHRETLRDSLETGGTDSKREIQEKLKDLETQVHNKDDKITQLEKLNIEYETQIQKLNQDLNEKEDDIVEEKKKRSAIESNTSNRSSISPENREYTKEILSLIEINSAHCKRYHALEKAYRDLTLEYAAYKQMVEMSSRSSMEDVTVECGKHEDVIKKLMEENGYLSSTLADYKRINTLLLDQIKVSMNHAVLEDSLLTQSTTQYDRPEKDTSSTLSVDDRNELWWENEVAMHPSTLYDPSSAHTYTLAYNPPCTEAKSI